MSFANLQIENENVKTSSLQQPQPTPSVVNPSPSPLQSDFAPPQITPTKTLDDLQTPLHTEQDRLQYLGHHSNVLEARVQSLEEAVQKLNDNVQTLTHALGHMCAVLHQALPEFYSELPFIQQGGEVVYASEEQD